jgi:hypothetical protein
MKNKILKTVAFTFLGTVSFAQVTNPFNSSTASLNQIVGFDGTTVAVVLLNH